MPTTAVIAERMALIGSYFDGEKQSAQTDELQVSLLRLSYANPATMAIAQYDRGFPGNSMRDVLATFIPRILWPDKPVFNLGQEFAFLGTGQWANTAVSFGLFAEAYWNFGWINRTIVNHARRPSNFDLGGIFAKR